MLGAASWRRFDEDGVPAFPDPDLLRRCGTIAVHTDSTMASFQGLGVELTCVWFGVHERSGPDCPNVSEVGVLATQGLVRRDPVHCRVWDPNNAQVRRALH